MNWGEITIDGNGNAWVLRSEAEAKLMLIGEIAHEMRREIAGKTLPIVLDAATLHWVEKIEQVLD